MFCHATLHAHIFNFIHSLSALLSTTSYSDSFVLLSVVRGKRNGCRSRSVTSGRSAGDVFIAIYTKDTIVSLSGAETRKPIATRGTLDLAPLLDLNRTDIFNGEY
eukprot:scaffold4715_cov115-Cylindrotheca_fusiformis.AAC.12